MEKNIETTTEAKKKKLEVEDGLLYYGDKRIYQDQLVQKISRGDWGKRGMGLGYNLVRKYDPGKDGHSWEPYWQLYIDDEFCTNWDLSLIHI